MARNKKSNHLSPARYLNVIKIILVALFMFVGITLLKYFPMEIFGPNILFDASLHLTLTIFILYSIWLFIEHKRKSKIFLLVSVIAVALVSLQRIYANAHDLSGLLAGYFLSLAAIGLSEYLVRDNK